MSKTTMHNSEAMSNHVRELTNQANEPTADELEHVSGGLFDYGRIEWTYTKDRPALSSDGERSMGKTNDTSKLNHATLDDHGTLADSELGAVTGGTKASGHTAGGSIGALGYMSHIPMGLPFPPPSRPR